MASPQSPFLAAVPGRGSRWRYTEEEGELPKFWDEEGAPSYTTSGAFLTPTNDLEGESRQTRGDFLIRVLGNGDSYELVKLALVRILLYPKNNLEISQSESLNIIYGGASDPQYLILNLNLPSFSLLQLPALRHLLQVATMAPETSIVIEGRDVSLSMLNQRGNFPEGAIRWERGVYF